MGISHYIPCRADQVDNVKEYINHMVHYLQAADLNDADTEALISKHQTKITQKIGSKKYYDAVLALEETFEESSSDSKIFQKLFFLPIQKIKEQEEIEAQEQRIQKEKAEKLKDFKNENYKTVLILAKAVALQNSADAITLEHVSEATKYLLIKDEEIIQLFEDAAIEIKEDKVIASEKLYVEALDADSINFSEEVKIFIEKIKQHSSNHLYILYLGKRVSAKDCLLLAKSFAYDTESEFITLTHLLKAINSFNITDETLQKAMAEKEEIVQVENVEEKIAAAKTFSIKNFDQECLESPQYLLLKKNIDQIIGEVKE